MFLGIDIGTSGVKAVVLSPDGVIAEQSTAPLRVSRPHPLWSEQDPADWWSATQAAVEGLSQVLRAQIRGIGLAGQMHGATLLDANDRPLRPAILWNDGRSFAECSELEHAVPNSRAITGNLAMSGFTAPKLVWVRAHEPEIFAQIRTILLPKDYVRLCMTGARHRTFPTAPAPSGSMWARVIGAMPCWMRAASRARTCRHYMKATKSPELCDPLLQPSGAWIRFRSSPAPETMRPQRPA